MAPLSWDELDAKAVDTARILAADAVEKVGNGHPGTAMSLAPAAYLLFQKVMRRDPKDHSWLGRDRFILSAGHSSLTQYVQLYLGGEGLELDDLKALRTWGSKTPGHPEYGHTAGVEITTGPLGQGLASAVGFAYAARYERGLFDPEAAAGTSPFDHFVYVVAGDGDIQEGVTAESAPLAGHQKLGNLIAIYDSNQISIEDDTQIAFSEDVAKRYEAYGWQVLTVDWKKTGEYVEDVHALYEAIEEAKGETDKPSLIILKTIIGWPSPKKQNTGKIHGSALGADELAAVKQVLGFDPEKTFDVADEVIEHTRKLAERGAAAHAEWQVAFDAWAAANPERKELLERLERGELPEGVDEALPSFDAGTDVSTRAASGKVLTALGAVIPELWGGSADLAESNNTTIGGAKSFVPAEHSTHEWTGDPYGRVLHFGIREHAMGSILNGIVLHGKTRAFGGTFLIFSDYMRPAVRLAALMQVPSIFVWTHDSVALGEDGPTHQRWLRPRPSAFRPPAGRAADDPARHPGSRRGPPRRRQRGRRGLEDDPGAPQRARGHRAQPPEPARVRARGRRGDRRDVRRGGPRQQGRVHPGGGPERHARRHPPRLRLRGAVRRRGARRTRPGGHPGARRLGAVPGVVRGAECGVPRVGAAGEHSGARVGRGRPRAHLGALPGRRRAFGLDRALRRLG